MKRIGTRLQVMNGLAKQTGGGLKKKDLKYNKRGKIVSKKLSAMAIQRGGVQRGGGNKINISVASGLIRNHLELVYKQTLIRGDLYIDKDVLGQVYKLLPTFKQQIINAFKYKNYIDSIVLDTTAQGHIYINIFEHHMIQFSITNDNPNPDCNESPDMCKYKVLQIK